MCDEISCGTHDTRPPVPVPDEKRRLFVKGLASLPLAAVLANPELTRAAAHKLMPATIKNERGEARGYLAVPDKTPAPAVLLIHEWWGLNDQIKAVANDMARAGFLAFAIDMFNGSVATTREQAMAQIRGLDVEAGTRAVAAAVEWLRNHEKGNGKVGTVGWCFGGGWSLNASLAAPVDATVIYYGNVKKSAKELASLQGPVLGHFGTLDKRINAEMVGDFERAMMEAGKTDLTIHWYTADHAFANPSGARYDKDDANLAWTRTLAFLHKHLGE
ncbi:MAG: dienelactone hydrolase family protein [Gammaproteobacteria bacterium]